MYFDNITNNELQYFHGLMVPNFTITLSDVLHQTSNVFDNKLFKVEEIIENKLYRIYPMFYTKKITSSNPNDKIIDDKLIIANKTTSTTHLTFVSDETQEIQDYTPYGIYYSIGDTLTTAQYNSIVSLLRNNIIHKDLIKIMNGTITSDYGEYEINITDVSILDKGILISSETLTANPKIRLKNKVFNKSTYTFKYKVLRYTDVNLLNETTSNITIIDMELDLTDGNWKNLTDEELVTGDIILYDAEVKITHDQPVITGSWINTLTVTADKDVFQTGDTCNITATALDMGNIGLANAPVSFKFYDSNDTLIDTKTGTTDTNGQCTVSYLGQGTGALNIQCNCMNVLETYSLLDCLFLDYGVTGNKNSNWTNYSNRLTVTTDSNGTLLESNTSSNGYYFINNREKIYNNWILEFDVLDMSSVESDLNILIHLQNANSNEATLVFKRAETGLGHFRIEHKNNEFKLYVDNVLIKTDSHSALGNHEIAFRLNNYATDKARFIKYKNLRLLPI